MTFRMGICAWQPSAVSSDVLTGAAEEPTGAAAAAAAVAADVPASVKHPTSATTPSKVAGCMREFPTPIKAAIAQVGKHTGIAGTDCAQALGTPMKTAAAAEDGEHAATADASKRKLKINTSTPMDDPAIVSAPRKRQSVAEIETNRRAVRIALTRFLDSKFRVLDASDPGDALEVFAARALEKALRVACTFGAQMPRSSVIARLQSGEGWARRCLLDVLSKVGLRGGGLSATVQQLCADQDTRVRIRAMEVFAAFGPIDAALRLTERGGPVEVGLICRCVQERDLSCAQIATLAYLLKHPVSDIRRSVVEILASQGLRAEPPVYAISGLSPNDGAPEALSRLRAQGVRMRYRAPQPHRRF